MTAHFTPSQMHPREGDLHASDEPPRLTRRVAVLFIVVSSVALWALVIAGVSRLIGHSS